MAISPISLLYPPACLLCHQRLDPSTRATASGHGPSLGMSPESRRGVVLSERPSTLLRTLVPSRSRDERSESKDDVVGLHTGTPVVCEACSHALQPLLPPVCQRCGVGVAGAYDSHVVCPRCQVSHFVFEKACAPFSYTGMVRKAVHAFKYKGHDRLGLWFAARMAHVARAQLPLGTIERVVPVPLHWLKGRIKGRNAVAFLAKAVAAELALPYDVHALRRRRWTASQTRLTRAQRVPNVAGAFTARRRLSAHSAVLLIDDVLTSGATAQACALAFQERAVKTFILTAACAPHAHGS